MMKKHSCGIQKKPFCGFLKIKYPEKYLSIHFEWLLIPGEVHFLIHKKIFEEELKGILRSCKNKYLMANKARDTDEK